MSRHEEAKAALADLLHDLGAEPATPIDLYAIGVPLVGQEFTQDEIVSALYAFHRDGQIALIEGNRLRATISF